MFKDERKKSEFSVDVLNMDAFAKIVVTYLIGAGYELNGNTRINSRYPLGIVTGRNGKHYLIDEDGCGEGEALEDEPQKIAWYKRTVDNDGKTVSFNMFPFVEMTFSKEELEAVPVLSTKTLDKFVRVSGGERLSRLFYNWTKFLETGIVPKY